MGATSKYSFSFQKKKCLSGSADKKKGKA